MYRSITDLLSHQDGAWDRLGMLCSGDGMLGNYHPEGTRTTSKKTWQAGVADEKSEEATGNPSFQPCLQEVVVSFQLAALGPA